MINSNKRITEVIWRGRRGSYQTKLVRFPCLLNEESLFALKVHQHAAMGQRKDEVDQ